MGDATDRVRGDRIFCSPPPSCWTRRILRASGSVGMITRTIKKLLAFPLVVGVSRMKCGAHVTRYAMYERLRTVLDEPQQALGKKVLSISHSDVLIPCLGVDRAEIVEANYPEYSAVDLSAFASEQFDYVISDQVLEHVEGNPQDVFSETYRLLKHGGVAVHTTCFINPVHGWPSDFWRFTPSCLAMLAKDFSKIIEVGGFGNRLIWIVDFLGLRFSPVPHAPWHPLHKIATKNDPHWPVSTWIVARK
jgi:SAM-dependent methyltransferase